MTDPTNVNRLDHSQPTFLPPPKVRKVNAISKLAQQNLMETAARTAKYNASEEARISRIEDGSDIETYIYIFEDSMAVPTPIKNAPSQRTVRGEDRELFSTVEERMAYLMDLCKEKIRSFDEESLVFVAAEMQRITPAELTDAQKAVFNKLKTAFTKRIDTQSKKMVSEFHKRLKVAEKNRDVIPEIEQTATKIKHYQDLFAQLNIDSKGIQKNLKEIGQQSIQALKKYTKGLIKQEEAQRLLPIQHLFTTAQTERTASQIISIANSFTRDLVGSITDLSKTVDQMVDQSRSSNYTAVEFKKYMSTQSKLLKGSTLQPFLKFCDTIDNPRLTPQMKVAMQKLAKEHFLNNILPKIRKSDIDTTIMQFSTVLTHKNITDPLRRTLEKACTGHLAPRFDREMKRINSQYRWKSKFTHATAVGDFMDRLMLKYQNLPMRPEQLGVLVGKTNVVAAKYKGKIIAQTNAILKKGNIDDHQRYMSSLVKSHFTPSFKKSEEVEEYIDDPGMLEEIQNELSPLQQLQFKRYIDEYHQRRLQALRNR